MTRNITLTCPLLVAAVLTSGCARQPTIPVAEFGETVRNVMESQIHDHEAAIHPDPNALEGSDPYRLEGALNAYREDVAKPEEIQQPITIRFD